jgi:serine beta-lactamase-like protein LACTB
MNKLSTLLVGFFLIHALLVSQSFPQNKIADSKYKRSIAEGRKLVNDLMTKQEIPGLSIAVSVNDKIVWSEGFGFADLESNVPATPNTLYRIGSVSKLLTSTAVAKLFEQGLIDLDAPVQKYVPFFPAKEFEITPRQLLGHLAGIRHYKRTEFVNQQHYQNVAESLRIFQTDPLLHQPNSKYFYSSYGYVLLSNVIEGASKQDFSAFLQTRVFDPLKMTETTVDDNQKIIFRRSRFYSRGTDGQISNEIFADYSDRLAAGGFLSTAADLASFGAKTSYGDFFKPETKVIVFTPQKTTDGKETGVGFGWRIAKDKKGRTIYHHGGDSVGGRAILIVYPDSKVTVAILCNLTFAKITEADAGNIADLFIQDSLS